MVLLLRWWCVGYGAVEGCGGKPLVGSLVCLSDHQLQLDLWSVCRPYPISINFNWIFGLSVGLPIGSLVCLSVHLVVTRRRYIDIYIASVSTHSYVENWYIETISYMRYMGRSRYVGTSIELIVLVESIDETPK